MATNDDQRPYRTVDETAALLRVSKRTVQNWIERGLLKETRAGSRVLVARNDLDEFLARSAELARKRKETKRRSKKRPK